MVPSHCLLSTPVWAAVVTRHSIWTPFARFSKSFAHGATEGMTERNQFPSSFGSLDRCDPGCRQDVPFCHLIGVVFAIVSGRRPMTASAVTTRLVIGLEETFTIRTHPSSAIWENLSVTRHPPIATIRRPG